MTNPNNENQMNGRKYHALLIEERIRALDRSQVRDLQIKVDSVDPETKIRLISNSEAYELVIKEQTIVDKTDLIFLGSYQNITHRCKEEMLEWPGNVQIHEVKYFGWGHQLQEENFRAELLRAIESFKKERMKIEESKNLLPAGMPELQLN